jgi:aconitase A
LTVNGIDYVYYSLPKAEANGLSGVSRLPYSMKVLLENLLRFEDGRSVTKEHILSVAAWLSNKGTVENEIAYRPARVLMQDFTGVPAVVDLAAMRDAMVSLGATRRRSTRSFPSILSSTIRSSSTSSARRPPLPAMWSSNTNATASATAS